MAGFFTRRMVATVAAVALVAGAVAGVAGALIAGGHGGPPETAEVTRSDLTMKIGGTLGYGGTYAVTVPSGTSAVRVAQAQQAVAQDQQTLAGDEQAESDDSAAQSAANSAAARLTAKTGYDQAQNKVLSDQVKLSGDQAVLGTLQGSQVNPGTVYTWLPVPGQVIRQGQRLYSVSGRPVPLLYGAAPAYRAFYPGMSGGPDVRELNRDLAALGYGAKLAKSDQYTPDTSLAVERWQKAQSLPVTGLIPLGGVVFEPGPARVTSVMPSAGQSVTGAGGTVLAATGTTPVITAGLTPSQHSLLNPGDAVSVTLPDGTATDGHVTKFTTEAAIITLDNAPSQALPGLEPVTVTVGSQKADHVLAVPANALLAIPGGYGLDVVTGNGSLRLTAVTTGLRSDTAVQVSGPGITDGTTVAVPSSLGQQTPG